MGLQAIILKEEGRIIIETDSSILVNLLHEVVAEDHPRVGLLKECREMLQRIIFATVCYIPRICNGCAHLLAQCGYNQGRNDVVWVDVLPPEVRTVIIQDMLI